MTHAMSEPWVKWERIETAPKDGTIVLIGRSDGQVYAAYWGLSQRVAATGASDRFPWVILDETNVVNHLSNGGVGATHWARLPGGPQ
jgi:hypothetical protein